MIELPSFDGEWVRRRQHVRAKAAAPSAPEPEAPEPEAPEPEVAIPTPRPEPEPEPVVAKLGWHAMEALTACVRTYDREFHIYDGLTGPCRCGLRTRGNAR